MAQRLSDYTNALADAGTLDGSEVLYLASNEKTTVGAVRGGYTTTTVSISSAQLLAINSTPIQILPALGTGKYYEYTAILKYTYVTTAYSVSGGGALYLNQGSKDCYFDRLTIAQTENAVSTGTFYGFAKMNNAVNLTSDANPTLGDGTVQIVITHRTITF